MINRNHIFATCLSSLCIHLDAVWRAWDCCPFHHLFHDVGMCFCASGLPSRTTCLWQDTNRIFIWPFPCKRWVSLHNFLSFQGITSWHCLPLPLDATVPLLLQMWKYPRYVLWKLWGRSLHKNCSPIYVILFVTLCNCANLEQGWAGISRALGKPIVCNGFWESNRWWISTLGPFSYTSRLHNAHAPGKTS